MRKPDRTKKRTTAAYGEEDFGRRPRRSEKPGKTPKRLRYHDLDLEDDTF